MFKNFYFIAIRNLLKHKGYSLINISGLAIGIAGFIFISFYIINELSYDRFHSNYENIYRINGTYSTAVMSGDNATTPVPLANTLLNNYPEVVKATRILKSGSFLIGRGNKKISEDGILFADSSFFDVFDFKLMKGNPKTVLVHPRSMVLSESYAKKYFGDEDPIGQKITMEEDTTFYIVTGIVQDVPANSHIQFDMLGSVSSNDDWNSDRWVRPGRGQHTYVVLNNDAKMEVFEEKIQEIIYEHVAPEVESYTGGTFAEWESGGNYIRYRVIPLKDIYLRSTSSEELEPTGNIAYIYTYSLVGLIILFIAIFNFVNLATAKSSLRAKEVGVRKVIGSTKRNLIQQFIFESIIVALVATFFAILIVTLFTPSFLDLIGKELAIGLTTSYVGWLSIAGLAILVGILAGLYPAFVLSAFKPVEVLKGTFSSGAKSGWLQKFLVSLQFAATIVIIIGTLVIYNQINFMLTKNLGFDKEQILVINRPDGLKRNLEVFKNNLLENPNIRYVSNSNTIPGKKYKVRSYGKKGDPNSYVFKNNQITYSYQELMGLEMVSGRFFSKEHRLDSNAVVINESAAKAFGFENPVGKNLTSVWKPGRSLTIIGVVKDYNTESLHRNIRPVSLELSPNNIDGYVSIKMSNSQNIRETIQFIEDTWYKYSDNKPFQYFFFDEDYENLYKAESTTGQVLIVFSTLSIFIACLGLIGLISYTASIRKKEIGIRKVLGAGTTTLIRLLSNDFIKLMIIATFISWPLAYFATDYWLRNFADRLDINPWVYLISTIIVVLICSFAISFQTIKTAMNNPIDSLRDE